MSALWAHVWPVFPLVLVVGVLAALWGAALLLPPEPDWDNDEDGDL